MSSMSGVTEDPDSIKEKPQCGSCAKGGHECQYIDPSQPSARRNKITELEDRIRELEGQLASQHLGNDFEDDLIGTASKAVFGSSSIDGASPAASSSHNPPMQHHMPLSYESLNVPAPSPPLSTSLTTLDWPYPPLDLTLHLVETFFNCCPFVASHLHKKSFFERMLLPSSNPDAPHPSLVYAICAAASRHSPRVTTPIPTEGRMSLFRGDGDTFFDTAVALSVKSLEQESDSNSSVPHKVKTLSAVLVLVHLMHSENKWTDLHRYTALGMRGMVTLKFHVDQSLSNTRTQLVPLKNDFDREQRKRLMFSFWVFDVLYTNWSGSFPSNLSSQHILLRLPTPTNSFVHASRDDDLPETEPYLNSLGFLENHSSNDGFHLIIKSTMLLDKVNDFNHQSKQDAINLNLTSSKQLPAFNELDTALLRFRSRLPDVWEDYDEGSKSKLNVDIYFAHILSLKAFVSLHNGYMRESSSKKRLMGCVRAALSTLYSLLNSSYELSWLPSYAIAFYGDSVEILIAAFNQTYDQAAKEAIKLELATFGELFRRMKKSCPSALFGERRLHELLFENGINSTPPGEPSVMEPLLQEISSYDVAAPMPSGFDNVIFGDHNGVNDATEQFATFDASSSGLDIPPGMSFTASDEYKFMSMEDVLAGDAAFDVNVAM
ncbi:hypothetical protein E3P99_03870 [Wallemia hederae]|uniref:Xylanolytic transcriptional activator regulatory domain-containing protein n=1 Tax=Wallemia hederae TaxID=1540922 RepID=A0A4T0FGN9_9BASI|nr:hypothetical protein E3P99_03870 [Wallemia hederae]